MPETTAHQFEWDETKRFLALEKQGIDFNDAIRIFDRRPTIHAPSNQSHADEQCWITTGDLDGLMISVVWTYRGGRIQIITARRARNNEQSEFDTHHPQ